MYHFLLSLSYITASILQSYAYVQVTAVVNPIILFCYISLCISSYGFISMLEDNKTFAKTIEKLYSMPFKTFLTIVFFDSLADFFNTIPRVIKGLDYSSHAILEKSDSIFALLFAIFVRKNAKCIDYISTIFIIIGISIYFLKILPNFAENILSLATLSICLSKLFLEVSIFIEGETVRTLEYTENHVLFLTNIGAPITFAIGLLFFPEILFDLYKDLLIHYEIFIYTIIFIIWYIIIPYLSPILLSYIIYTIKEDKIKLMMMFVGIMWIVMMKIKMKCHLENFSNITFSIMTAIIFCFKAVIKAEDIFNEILLTTIFFVTLGTLTKALFS